MSSLLQATNHLERIPIADGELYYLTSLSLGATTMQSSISLPLTFLGDRRVFWFGVKCYLQPRLVAWYGDSGSDYTYSGITLTPLPWTELLLEIKRKIETVTEGSFNSVLLNYYRDNRDSMGFHSDDEPELGLRPVIASLSLGEERTLIMKHRAEQAC